MLDQLRRILHAGTRYPAVRTPVLGATELLCRGSARLLCAGGEIEDVLVRGSYAEGGFRPFLSDIDLALLVRRPRGTHPYDSCRALHRRLRTVRLTNPFVRDVWQTILPEPQWPLLRAFGALYGAPRWRSLTGRAPMSADPVEPRLALAAWWNRQHLWTCLAQRQALAGKVGVRALPGSLRKAGMYARRIATELGVAHEGTDGGNGLAAAIDALARSTGLVTGAFASEAGLVMAESNTMVDPTPREARALDSLERFAWAGQLAGIASAEGYLLLLADATWSREQSRRALRDLVQVRAETGVTVQLHRAATMTMAPWRPPVRVLRRRAAGLRLPAAPFLLREQLVYEALFAATNLWAAAGHRDALPAIRAHLLSSAELCLFLLTDEPRREARPLPELVAELGASDAALGEVLSPFDAGSARDVRALFAMADAITTRIADLLSAHLGPSVRERVS